LLHLMWLLIPGKVITGVKFRDGIEVAEDAGTNDKSDNQPARIAA